MKAAVSRFFSHSNRMYHTKNLANTPSSNITQAVNKLFAIAGERLNTIPPREVLIHYTPKVLDAYAKFVNSQKWPLISNQSLVSLTDIETCSEKQVKQYETYLSNVVSSKPLKLSEFSKLPKEAQANLIEGRPELPTHYLASCK